MEDAGDEDVVSTGPAAGRPGGDGDGNDRDRSDQNERDRDDADGGTDARGGDEVAPAAPLVRAWRRAPRPLVVAAGVAVVALLVGGLTIASRADGDTAAPATTRPLPRPERSSPTTAGAVASTTTPPPTTTTTTESATTTTVPPATAPPSTSAPASGDGPASQAAAPPDVTMASSARCGPGPWPSGGTLPTVPVAPGQAAAHGPPSPGCADVAAGCSVSFTLMWSDGYTETGSQVLTSPGAYTLSGDRGTTWNFAVHGDMTCSSSGGNYSNVWPGGA